MSKSNKSGDKPQLDSRDAEQIQTALRRGWSRRDVMKMMLASGMTATVAGDLFSEQQQVFAQTPKKGGTIKYIELDGKPGVKEVTDELVSKL